MNYYTTYCTAIAILLVSNFYIVICTCEQSQKAFATKSHPCGEERERTICGDSDTHARHRVDLKSTQRVKKLRKEVQRHAKIVRGKT